MSVATVGMPTSAASASQTRPDRISQHLVKHGKRVASALRNLSNYKSGRPCASDPDWEPLPNLNPVRSDEPGSPFSIDAVVSQTD